MPGKSCGQLVGKPGQHILFVNHDGQSLPSRRGIGTGGISSRSSPAAGTTVVSNPRAVPSAVSATAGSSRRSSRPVAIKGDVCPAVPPPASTTEPEAAADWFISGYCPASSASRPLSSCGVGAASPSWPGAYGPLVLGGNTPAARRPQPDWQSMPTPRRTPVAVEPQQSGAAAGQLPD